MSPDFDQETREEIRETFQGDRELLEKLARTDAPLADRAENVIEVLDQLDDEESG